MQKDFNPLATKEEDRSTKASKSADIAVEAAPLIKIDYGFEHTPGGPLSLEPLQVVRECFEMGTTPNFGFSSKVKENNYVRSCKWSSNGEWLLADSEDRTCRIFAFRDEKVRYSFHIGTLLLNTNNVLPLAESSF